MTIDGVSQAGAERLVDVTAAEAGIKLVIRDKKAELASLELAVEPLMAILTDHPEGMQSMAGGESGTLEIEVKRNEVLLTVGSHDAAVGLDDMMDAVSATIPA